MEVHSQKQIKRVASNYLLSSCLSNNKTSYLSYEKLERQEYITVIEPRYAQLVFKARLQIFPIRVNFPQMYKRNLLCFFCEKVDETFHHLFGCDSGPYCKQSVKDLINAHLTFPISLICEESQSFLLNIKTKNERFGHEGNLLLLVNARTIFSQQRHCRL